MNIAYVFPGQGSQFKGMGADVFNTFPGEVAQADEILGYSIRSLCVDDPGGVLAHTQYTQAALYTVGVLMWLDRLRCGESPHAACFAGHSLGEYCALFAAGAFDFATGLRLVKRRGELMSRAPKGAMAAVLGMSPDAVRERLRQGNLESVDLANINSSKQIVLSGQYDEIHSPDTTALFEKAGATFMPLNVSGPFHSRHMREVERQFHADLSGFAFRPLMADVISNVTARPYPREKYTELLSRQISSPVKWYEAVSWMLTHGCGRIEQIGPGTVLARLTNAIRAEPMSIITDLPGAAEVSGL